jgi:hypothetical protein
MLARAGQAAKAANIAIAKIANSSLFNFIFLTSRSSVELLQAKSLELFKFFAIFGFG